MQKASTVQLQREVERLKKSINKLNKRAASKQLPLIIEKIDESMLTIKQKKRMHEIINDIKHNKKEKFLTLEEFKAAL